ncbi:hypothetical protein PRZ48_010162 [Zasmidium cellare]|uniref:Large ribosomal subunit protein uL29m n=1 Tax=Zasmidium cellare TaxID=395010 RepID=A0ABR0EDR4_ZASCE|nr:hypothetical protein PRZ48_010162 [Zasmidium cellare]
MHCTARTLLSGVLTPSLTRPTTLPPSFLLPALQTASFTSTPNPLARKKRKARKDNNPQRGQSALHRTGLKNEKLSVSLAHLPQPVLDPRQRSTVEVDVDHGLWDFFPADRSCMATPADLSAHGRAWTVGELRNKDWDDLHRLWWVCIKEMNRIKTFAAERERIGNMYGAHESEKRIVEVKNTMKAIKHTLTERWYAWDNARNAAMEDDEINMYADLDNGEAAYIPKAEEEQNLAESTPAVDSTLPPPSNQPPQQETRA